MTEEQSKTRRFSAYLTKKFIEYQVREERLVTQSEYARYLGISQATLSQYMAGNEDHPSMDMLYKIADKLGNEVCQIWEIPPKISHDSNLWQVILKWDDLSNDTKNRILNLLQR